MNELDLLPHPVAIEVDPQRAFGLLPESDCSASGQRQGLAAGLGLKPEREESEGEEGERELSGRV